MGLAERSRSKGNQEIPAAKKASANVAGARVMIVEDDPRSAQQASSILAKMGVSQIQAIPNVGMALEHLRQVVEDRAEMPNLLLLDLEFSLESGFEVLRYWKANPRLRDMHVVVWTVMGDLEQKISKLFGVDKVLDKHLGPGELEKVLRSTLKTAETS